MIWEFFQDMEGLVLNRLEIPVEIQDMEIFQDMEMFLDVENFKDLESNITHSL